MRFEIPRNKLDGGLVRSDFIILNIIASNAWKRPIYFTSPMGELGFAQYLRKDGMAYRLVPAVLASPQQNWVVEQAFRQNGLGGTQIRANNLDSMYKTMMNDFEFGGAGKKVFIMMKRTVGIFLPSVHCMEKQQVIWPMLVEKTKHRNCLTR